ncbi:autoinducer binding domain-containing protein [Aureimonas ureilytica]|uniref:autoinducer binding domain-containing protein n=1 Tax=Aureimonas ureilytica TaxID=401562 RepID=UPI00187C1467|nr:autoinducer binding domain-containing protein [Aureimonas ureilytica]
MKRTSQNLLADTHALMKSFEACRTKADLEEAVRKVSEPMGVTSHLVGIVPNGTVRPRDQPDYVLAGTWPSEWAKRYFARQYVQEDPAIEHARTRIEPLRWDSARATGVGQRILQEACEFGLSHGMTIPQFTLDGLKIGVSFSAIGWTPRRKPRRRFCFWPPPPPIAASSSRRKERAFLPCGSQRASANACSG